MKARRFLLSSGHVPNLAMSLLAVIALVLAFAAVTTGAPAKEESEVMMTKVHWLGHDCFRVDAEKVVYFDPYEIGSDPVPADVIFITHEHSDHCSPKDVAKIQKKGTVIVANEACAKKLSVEVRTVESGDTLTVEGLKVEVVPAYNVKTLRKLFHPKGAGGVGYIVTLGGKRVYHAGDTDFIPEMKDFKVEVAFIPVSGKYVMTAEEAAEAVKVLKPEITVPMHYGTIVGSEKDAQNLKKLVAPLRVEILKREK